MGSKQRKKNKMKKLFILNLDKHNRHSHGLVIAKNKQEAICVFDHITNRQLRNVSRGSIIMEEHVEEILDYPNKEKHIKLGYYDY